MADPSDVGPGAPTATSADDLFRLAPCGYVVTDRDGVVVQANDELARLVGVTVGELVGRPLSSLLTVGGRIYNETHLLPMLGHDGGVREVDLDLRHREGHRVSVLLNADAAEPGGAAMRAVLIETRDRRRYEQDLLEATRRAEEARRATAALAMTLQQSLIPPAPPEIDQLSIAAAYRPAGDGSTVGGDFYDVFQVGPQDWVVAIGDVSGKGVEAAAVTSFVRYTIRALAIVHSDPERLLELLDAAMHVNRTEHYCTLVLARLSLLEGRWRMELALAGHPPAILRRPDGSTSELGRYGSPVGLVEAAAFHSVRHDLVDEVVVLYTDGVTEARSALGLLGEERLAEVVAQAPHDPEAVVDSVVAAALDHQGGTAADDIAVVAFASSGDHRVGPVGLEPTT